MVVVKAQSQAVATTDAPAAAGASAYGVFRLSYDVANVSGLPVRPLPCLLSDSLRLHRLDRRIGHAQSVVSAYGAGSCDAGARL